MKILVTGSSGYIGSMLVDQLLQNESVTAIVGIDEKEPAFLYDRHHPKFSFVQDSLENPKWMDRVKQFGSYDAIFHTAYHIKTPYTKKAKEKHKKANIGGAQLVFQFAFEQQIPFLLHCSTVASYGARKKNAVERPLEETDPLSEHINQYGIDKKIIEENLQSLYAQKKPKTRVAIFRIGSVTGPFAQSRAKKSGLLPFLKGAMPCIPVVGNTSLRQYVHEDDVVSSMITIFKQPCGGNYEIYNIAPQSHLSFSDIADILKKYDLPIPFFIAKFTFSFLWHVTRGKIPTPPGTINSYTYPIFVDGTKITQCNFSYQYTARDAFVAKIGRYL